MIVFFVDTAEQLRDALVTDLIQRENSAAAYCKSLERARENRPNRVTLKQVNAARMQYNDLARERQRMESCTIRPAAENPFSERTGS